MSTPNTDLGNVQEASRGGPGTIYSEDTLKLEKMSPTGNVPQPPQPPSHNRRRIWFAVAAVVIVLALVFSVLAVIIVQPGKNTGTKVTPTAPGTTITTPGSDTTPTPSPGVTLGPQNGPSNVNTLAYWDTILGTKGTNGKVESVSFANVMGNSTLQALVTVRHNDANSTLDVYVFNNITSKNPTQIFKLEGLIKGKAKISYYNSIMTAEVDQHSTVNAGKTVSQMTPDLYREFAWINGSMTQVAFPGIYPDLTRYQAEADQAQVNKGIDPWKYDPAAVAKATAVKFLQWEQVSAKVVSGGGPKDVYATVHVTTAAIPSLGLNITLSRLEGNTNNMWVVISVEDGSALTLTSVTPHSLVASPVKLEGTGGAFEGQIGKAIVLDHLYTDIGHATVNALPSATNPRPYSVGVIYNSTFQTGVQEGVIEVQQTGGGAPGIGTAVMVKVLLDPVPRVMLGPLACPDAVKDPAYWKQFLPGTVIPQMVDCANLLGKPTLQTVVIGRDTVGGSEQFLSYYVFDNIFSAHPKLLFKVEHLLQDSQGWQGDFTISAYSTVMTTEVDRNSSINKGKAYADMTNDLFREFQWSSKDGTFVQVAFPGLYPDLTRYQAEADQAFVVNFGKDPWKNDPAQVAKALEQKFFGWQGKVTTKVLSGGGPKDVYATVQVQEAPVQGGQSQGPYIVVTLSRLEGNLHNMWVATAVKDGTKLTLTNIPERSLISSPVTLTGTGSAFEAVIGQAVVYDHLYTDIGHAQIIGSNGMSTGPYNTKVAYTSSFKGVQEGIVVAYQDNAGISSENFSAVMVKVLIKG